MDTLEQALHHLATQVDERLKRELAAGGQVGSGKLYNSISTQLIAARPNDSGNSVLAVQNGQKRKFMYSLELDVIMISNWEPIFLLTNDGKASWCSEWKPKTTNLISGVTNLNMPILNT